MTERQRGILLSSITLGIPQLACVSNTRLIPEFLFAPLAGHHVFAVEYSVFNT